MKVLKQLTYTVLICIGATNPAIAGNSWELEKKSYDGFLQHSVEMLGYDGDVSHFSFVYRSKEKLLGHLVGKSFYGGLHIKHLFLDRN